MTTSRWHKLYSARIAAPADAVFELLSDMPNYGRWLGGSAAFGATTDVEPYPVRLGSRYRDGKTGDSGRDWWGKVTGFQRPGSLDFNHTIDVSQLRATLDVHIHYSIEQQADVTQVARWLLLDITMPLVLRPLRPLLIRPFDAENVRTMSALKSYAEAYPDGGRDARPGC